MNKPLTKRQVTSKLKSLHADWELSKTGTSIHRKFAFKNYISGFMFLTKVSVHAQVANHHPDIQLTYNFVKVTLSTHDAKTVASADFAIAEKCDDLYTLSTEIKQTTHNHY